MALQTTIGQVLVNETLPPELRDYERSLAGSELDNLLARIGREYPDKYREITHRLVQLGRETAFREGTTLSVSDLDAPEELRQEVIAHVAEQEKRIRNDKTLTPARKQEALGGVYGMAQKLIVDQTYDSALKGGNPLALQVLSKARGNPMQLAALLSTPAAFSDAKGKTIPIFIRRSYAEGLKPWEYYAATFGSRQAVISTKFCLDHETEIRMADFSVKRIMDIVVGDQVLTVDAKGFLVPTRVTGTSHNGMRLCWEYRFAYGRERKRSRGITATPEHRARVTVKSYYTGATTEGMRPLGEVGKGRCSLFIHSGIVPGLGVSEPFAGVIGALLGDGGISQHNVFLYATDETMIEALNSRLASTDISLKFGTSMESGVSRYIAVVENCGGSRNFDGNPLIETLDKYALMGKKAPEKFLPSAVWSWDRESCEQLVSFLLETDGCVTHVSNKEGRLYPVVSFYCTSETLAEDLHKLLEIKLGIICGKVGSRPVEGDESIFKLADGTQRRSIRNHDLHGFIISTRRSLEALGCIWRNSGIKSELLHKSLMELAPIYADSPGNRFRSQTFVGFRPTMDIEVEADSHQFVLANGAVVSNSTRDAGDLGKQMNVVSEGLMVTQDDCGTNNGIPVGIDDRDNVGAVLARDTGPFKMGTPVTAKVTNELKNQGYERLLLRSPTTCLTRDGLCKMCVGLREDGKFPSLRDAIGIKASSALAERIAQGALNVKHQGGQKEKGEERVYAGFDIIDQFAQVPAAFRHAAALANADGEIRSIEPAPQGGTNIMVGDEIIWADPEQQVTVKVGEQVEAGDQLSTGLINPAEVVKYKGIGEGRRYFAERMTKAFNDSKVKANRRNVEVLARALIDHVEVEDPEGLGDYLPGDVASYSGLAYNYRPRQNSAVVDPSKGLGQYLEQPVLQHTIGTRVTRRMLGELKEFGVDKVNVNPEPPTFTPQMTRLKTASQYGNDWLAKLHGTYLKSNLLSDVQAGSESNIHGTHPVPALAYGVEFGKSRPGKVTY